MTHNLYAFPASGMVNSSILGFESREKKANINVEGRRELNWNRDEFVRISDEEIIRVCVVERLSLAWLLLEWTCKAVSETKWTGGDGGGGKMKERK